MPTIKENVLIMTVGLPRSGKSTWAKAQGHPIVNPDSIRLSLYGQPYFQGGERHVWAIARTMVESLFLDGNKTVILDATNLSIPRVKDWLSPDWRWAFQIFDVDSSECVRRAIANNQGEIIPVIDRMAGKTTAMFEYIESMRQERCEKSLAENKQCSCGCGLVMNPN